MPVVSADPEGRISLVQDLLSPAGTSLAPTTPTAISVQLATLAETGDDLQSFIRVLLRSPSLWHGSTTSLPFQRSRDVFTAIHRGFLLRVENVKEEYGTGWRARRRLYYILDAFLAPLDEDVPPVLRLLASSAVLAALQSVKARKDPLYIGGRNLTGKAETAVLDTWTALLQHPEELEGTDRLNLPCWLATCVLTSIESSQLAVLPLQPFLDVLLGAISNCFADGRAFDHMDDDLSKTESGLSWHDPSPSRTLLSSLADAPLFGELGRLSQVVGKVIESVTTVEGLETVREHLARLERLVERVNIGWLRTRWSAIVDEADLTSELRGQEASNLPWTILKTLLFSLTMVHSSLISLLTSAPADDPAELALDLAACSIRSFGWLYFVTSRFGSDGFGAYRGVWYGALDLSNRATDPARIEALARNVEPKGPSKTTGVPYGATYYLNVVEQIIEGLPDDYLEGSTMPIAQRYLESAEHRDAFEAAHSVVLAIYQKGKRCADALAPWYTTLLLRSYPETLSAPQLRLAYTAVIRHTSDSSDPLAWLCIQKLIDATEAIPLTSSPVSTTGGGPADLSRLASPAHAPHATRSKEEGRPQDEDEVDAPGQSQDALEDARLTPLEAKALALPRGAHLLCLIDALGALNLTLLYATLEQLERLIEAEPTTIGAGEAKRAVVRCLLASLANQDAAKRVHAVQWWTEHGPALWRGAHEGSTTEVQEVL